MSGPAEAARVAGEPARDWHTPLQLLLVGAVFGSSFLFMRVAAPEMGAGPLVGVRLVCGSLVLLPFVWQARRQLPWQRWPVVALIGAINAAVPFLLFAWAAQRAPAAVGAICNAMAVLFTALVAFAAFGERIGLRRALALLAGFAGVVVLATAKVSGLALGPAVLAGTAAAFCYGIGMNLVKRRLGDLPPAVAAGATLSVAAVLVLPLALAAWPAQPVSAAAWSSAVALGVLGTGLAFIPYYRLIQRIGAPRAAVVAYLIPVFGALLAWLFLGEPVTVRMLLAGLLILGSVAASQRAR